MNECKLRMNEYCKQRINEWMIANWRWMNAWMETEDEWMNECMNGNWGWVNEWMHGWSDCWYDEPRAGFGSTRPGGRETELHK